MSRIYWHSKDHTSELLGAERAYMGSLCHDLAAPIVGDKYPSGGEHQFTRIMARSERDQTHAWTPSTDDQVRLYLWGSNRSLHFDGEDHEAFGAVLNTVIATESPTLCLLARLEGSCELHAWVAEEDRDWLASVIDAGRENNIYRAGMGWEQVAKHLRNGDGGPVITSYSVTDSFPSMSTCGWMDPAWPADMVAKNSYDYGALTEAQQEAISARQDEWYELDDDERWRLSFEGLQRNRYLQITPENLTKQGFYKGKSLWDAATSPEWRGETREVVSQ